MRLPIAVRHPAPDRTDAETLSTLSSLLRTTALLSLTTMMMVAGGPALAQTEGANDPLLLDTIIIDGGGAFDPLEEPRTIATITSEDIERSNIDTLGEALATAPNVVVTNQSNPLTFEVTVRGISDVGNVNSTGPTVGFFVDGVLLNQVGNAASFNPALVDAERVDVFLGPQTTSFSQSTTAGAVNVVTKKPTDEREFILEGDLGVFDGSSDVFGSGSFVVNTPILENGLLSARLVGFYNESDGFVQVFGQPEGDNLGQRSIGGRLSLRSKPTSDLTFDLQISYTETEFDGDTFFTSIELLEQGEYLSFVNPGEPDRNEDFIARFEARYDASFGTITSNTSFRVSETNDILDGDSFSTIDLSTSGVLLRTKSFSQEVRYEGFETEFEGIPGTLKFNGGASLSFNEFKTSDTVDFGPDIQTLGPLGLILVAIQDPTTFAEGAAALGVAPTIPAVLGEVVGLTPEEWGNLVTDDRQEVLNFGVYGDVAWRPVPRVEITGGLRFSYTRVDSSDQSISGGPSAAFGLLPNFGPVVASVTSTSIAPSLAVSYDWTDDLTTFVSYSVGFRPGGTSELEIGVIDEFDEETTRSIEVGVRGRFMNGQLGVSATAFYTQIDDFQAPVTGVFPDTLIPPATILDNVGDAESYGAELSVQARPYEGLTLQANAGVNFTEITEFTGVIIGSDPNNPPDLTGQDLPNAPEFTFSFTGEYEHPEEVLGDLRPFIRMDYNLSSDFLGRIEANPVRLDGFDTLDIRVGLRNERFNIELFAENIFDEAYVTTGGTSPAVGNDVPFPLFNLPDAALGPVGTPGAPRRFGIRGKIVF